MPPWEKYGAGGAPQSIPIGPQDPAAQYRGQAAATGIAAQQSNMQNDAVNRTRTQQQIGQDAAMFPAQQQAAQAQAELAKLKAEQARAEAATKDPFNAGQLQAAEADALSKIQTIDRIRDTYNNSYLPSIGLGAEFVRDHFGGTAAADINADIGTLKAGGALSEVLKMTQETGKTPFTPMSNSDVDLIARNKGNLDQAQSPKNFFSNLKGYQDGYVRAYAGAVGKRTLDEEIQRRMPNIPADKREAFRALALRKYEQTMGRKSGLIGSSSRAKRQGGGSGAFLGWED
jgi:hypothetical protein